MVEREWGQNSYIPLNVTNKSEVARISSNLPLSVKAIRQLVSTYTRLTEDKHDGSLYPVPQTIIKDSSKRGLVTLDLPAESSGSASADSRLRDTGEKDEKGESKR